MSFYLSKDNFYFYSLFFITISVLLLFLSQMQIRSGTEGLSAINGQEQRVIRCQLKLPNDLVQNLYYMAPDLQTAKKQLFNAKNGLMFDQKLFVKTTDFNGKTHVVSFSEVYCDAVGTQVTSI